MGKRIDEFEFHIGAFTPETIPMSRLAEYMSDLARLLGEPGHVHFVRVNEGSTSIVHRVDSEAVASVRDRARAANSDEAPADVRIAAQRLTKRLRSDNAEGARLIDPEGDNILDFRTQISQELQYPSVSEPGTVQGQVIRLGGHGDWVPVHLEDVDGRVIICEAKREKTKDLAPYYLNGLIRASGTGCWSRLESGGWAMENFRIHDFCLLKDETLLESLRRLREIPAKWKAHADPVSALDEIRHGRSS